MSVFRDERNRRDIFLGKHTIKEGECCVRWNLMGQSKVIVGPRRKWFYRSTVQFLTRVVAGSEEYLDVVFRDGTRQYINGPCFVFKNPVMHKTITVQKAFVVKENEAIVVFTEAQDSHGTDKRSVTREVVFGPQVFFPKPNQWLGETQWIDKKGTRSPLKVISLLSRSVEFKTPEVRSSDDAEFQVCLMVTFRVVDIEQMLKTTKDPINSLLAAMYNDIVTFTSTRTFEEFSRSHSQLNRPDSCPKLTALGESIGVKVEKIVYLRHFSARIQEMNDRELQARTKQRLESQTAQIELEIREERMAKANKIRELEERISSFELDNAMELKRLVFEAEANQKDAKLQVQREHQSALDAMKLEYYTTLKASGVDLTRFLVATNQQPKSRVVVAAAESK